MIAGVISSLMSAPTIKKNQLPTGGEIPHFLNHSLKGKKLHGWGDS